MNKRIKPSEVIALIAIILVFTFIAVDYANCDGKYVRGLFWMECIK